MGAYPFRLPDIGEGVAEAEIVKWHVEAGQMIEEDDPLLDVMTDKATVEITAPVAGKVVRLHGVAGEMRPVGSLLVEFLVPDVEGETVPPDQSRVATAGAPSDQMDAAPRQTQTPLKFGAEKPLAAPATRRRAHELGISLQYVEATGPGGRITRDDLERHIEQGAGRDRDTNGDRKRDGVTETPIIGLRRQIADRMMEATRRIPHITYVEEIDVTELEALRSELNGSAQPGKPRLTLLPFIIRALVRIMPDFPHINATYDDEAGVLRQFEAVHIGIATQTPAGLLVPVLRHSEALSVWECADQIARLSATAREGKASREQLSGSTITVTSLGPLGGIASTPIINHPEVAIIAPNRIVDRLTMQDGLVVARKVMNLSSSFDHRIVDGYDAARFIHAVKNLIEHPLQMLID